MSVSLVTMGNQLMLAVKNTSFSTFAIAVHVVDTVALTRLSLGYFDGSGNASGRTVAITFVKYKSEEA